jgi:hypothetical protein
MYNRQHEIETYFFDGFHDQNGAVCKNVEFKIYRIQAHPYFWYSSVHNTLILTNFVMAFFLAKCYDHRETDKLEI